MNSNKYIVNYNPNNEELNNFINKVNVFGDIYNNYEFSDCSKDIDENMKYNISGKMNNIVTKTGKNKKWTRILCKNKLEKDKEHKWKVKILNSQFNHIMIGISPVLKEEKLDYSDFIEKLNLPEYNENYNIFPSTSIKATRFRTIPVMKQEINSFTEYYSISQSQKNR